MNSKTEEDKTKGTETTGNKKSSQSFGFDDMPGMMNACCMDVNESGNLMGRSCKSFIGAMWWLTLMPLIFAGAALLLGYYLRPESIRVLWMVGWGSVIGIGVLGLISVRILRTKFNFHSK